jgi:hypothetical protein
MPVVEMKPIAKPRRQMTQADLDWLKSRGTGRLSPREDAASLVRKMRDEGP